MSLEELSFLATIAGGLGVPLAVIMFLREMRKEAKERELQTYAHVSSEYRAFLRQCLEHSDLQIYDYRYDHSQAATLTDEQNIKKIILFDSLVSLMETSYFLYEHGRGPFRKRQWEGHDGQSGWKAYLADWCKRPDFRSAWTEHLGYQYDENFIALMNKMMVDAEKSTRSPDDSKNE